MGTDHLSGAKRSRRGDEGPVPVAGRAAKRRGKPNRVCPYGGGISKAHTSSLLLVSGLSLWRAGQSSRAKPPGGAVLRLAHVLQEQSLYCGKARSSAGGMEEGPTLTKGFYYRGLWWVDPRLYLFSSTQRSAPAVIEKWKEESGKLEKVR